MNDIGDSCHVTSWGRPLDHGLGSSGAEVRGVGSTSRRGLIKLMTIGIIGLIAVGVTGLAVANPALLPHHPGYPSRGEFAYDRGQQNLPAAQSLRDAAESEQANLVQQIENPANATVLRQQGAGLLPLDPSSNRKTTRSVAEMNQQPK